MSDQNEFWDLVKELAGILFIVTVMLIFGSLMGLLSMSFH